MSQEKSLEDVKNVIDEILMFLELKATVQISEEEGVYYVQISTEKPGLLIGYHGENLESLQLITQLVCQKKLKKDITLVFDVDGYRQKKEESLKKLALLTIERVLAEKKPTSLPYLASWERKIIHEFLTGRTDVVSYSEGKGRQRRLLIKAK